MPRGPGQEEQQRRDRAPDDAGRGSDLEKLSKEGPPPGKCNFQEELGSSWGKVAEGSLELGLQGQVTRHTWGQWGSTCMGRGSLCQGGVSLLQQALWR